jgi:hypothetical protein
MGTLIPLASPSALQVFNSIVSGGQYGRIVFGQTQNPAAIATTQASASSITIALSPLEIVFTYNTIIINNTTNAAYTGSQDWNFDLSSFDNALTLLHEMGHVLSDMGWTGGLFNDNDGSAFVNQMNDNLLKVNCGSYLH